MCGSEGGLFTAEGFRRDIFKENQSAALAEWRRLAA
jgi:hypothetical protein